MAHFTDALIEELELNEDLTPLETMQALNRGEPRNVKAMGDEKLRMNQKICLDHNLLYALNIIEARMLEKGLIKIMTAEKDIAFDEILDYKIVGSSEADPREGRISDESPVGAALIGCKEGQIVKVETPGGICKYELLEIYK